MSEQSPTPDDTEPEAEVLTDVDRLCASLTATLHGLIKVELQRRELACRLKVDIGSLDIETVSELAQHARDEIGRLLDGVPPAEEPAPVALPSTSGPAKLIALVVSACRVQRDPHAALRGALAYLEPAELAALLVPAQVARTLVKVPNVAASPFRPGRDIAAALGARPGGGRL